MPGNGESMDLRQLYSFVKEKGGYESITTDGSWGLVAEKCGFSSSEGSALKLIYSTYLGPYGVFSEKIQNEEDLEEISLMEVDTDFSEVVSDVSEPNKDDFVDIINVGSSCESSNGVADKSGKNTKRKREGYARMLAWVLKVAENPRSLEIKRLPDKSTWKKYDGDELWKQVLTAREMMVSKRNVHSVAYKSIPNCWKKPMHPSMYEDRERVRSSQRVIPAKEPSSNIRAPSQDLEDTVRGAPVGPEFQAHLPEWTGDTYEGDLRYYGSCLWPLNYGEKIKHLVERERMGKGRHDSCACEIPGSADCVRFHIAEKSIHLRVQLGTCFYHMKFNTMGEQVALTWTANEEDKFEETIKSTPLSLQNRGKIVKAFHDKKWHELVNYYFNVFLLKLRTYQNRATPGNIDSDEEDSDFGLFTDGFRKGTNKSPISIFHSPKKARLSS